MNGVQITKERKGDNLGQGDIYEGRAAMCMVLLRREEKGLTKMRWLEESHENSVAWGSWSHLGRA